MHRNPDHRENAVLAGFPVHFILPFFLFASWVAASPARAGFPVEVGDDRGVSVRLETEPRRVVSLAPSLTEIVFLLGQEGKLAGVTRYCNHPPQAKALPKIGGIADPDVERIVAAAPDLVLCTTDGNPKEKVRVLERMGIPCFAVAPQDLSGIYAAIERIGLLLGALGKAHREAGALRARAAKASRKIGDAAPAVLFAVSTSPVIAAGKDTFMDELIRLAGGRNAASSFSGRYPRLGVEDLLAASPDLIFVAAMEGVEKFPPEVTSWKEIPAFRNGEVFSLDGDLVTRPGPRMITALEEVSRALDAWRERRRQAVAGKERGGGPVKRTGTVIVLLGACAAAAIGLSLLTGPAAVSFRQAFDALAGRPALGPSAETAGRIVLSLRLPRALLGCLVGGALSSSGLAFQALLRNPLADPYILGVSAGAAVGALFAALLLPADAFLPLPFCAFLGAVLAASVVFLLARRSGGVSRERLILMGVIVGAFLNAFIMLVVVLAPPGRIPGALYWLMGDLGLGTPGRVAVLFPYVAAGTLILFLLSRGLDLMLLGDDAAFQAGLPVEKVKAATYVTASLLAGCVVAVSGLIGFVGLIVPHAARVLVGSGHRRLVPASFLLGGAFLVLADIVARTVSPSGELPVGAVTALAGAPFFLSLLRRKGGKP